MEASVACFSDVADPRQDNIHHDLFEVMIIALCTMLCGGDDCSDMAEFGRARASQSGADEASRLGRNSVFANASTRKCQQKQRSDHSDPGLESDSCPAFSFFRPTSAHPQFRSAPFLL
jgi:hypothetical protein